MKYKIVFYYTDKPCSPHNKVLNVVILMFCDLNVIYNICIG